MNSEDVSPSIETAIVIPCPIRRPRDMSITNWMLGVTR